MNNRILSACRIPSLLLAAVLQFMPMIRAALPAVQTVSNLFAIVFRWSAVASSALGGIQAVSGASTVITTGNITATNGVGSTNRLLTAPQTATYYAATGLPPGISLSGINGSSSWKLLGIPTITGVYNVGLTAKSSATASAGETTTKTIVFTVLAGSGGGANTPPVASAQSVTTAEDTAKTITLVGTDADGNALNYAVVASPAHGTLTGTSPNLTYTPATNYNGADSFTFKANDGTVDSAAASVSITITAVNDTPVASAQSVTTAEDTARAITLTGSDVDGNSLTFAVVTQPTHGTLTGTAPNLTYSPATNYNGADSFTFKANDGTVDSAAASVSISVTTVNDAPVASAQSVTTAEDTAKAITLTGSDVDGNSLTFAVVTQPAHGTLTGTAPNLTYSPATNYNGADSFTFKANDGTVDSAAASVSISVTTVNDAPVASAQSVTTDKNMPQAITLAGSDVEGGTLTFTIVTQPVKGALSGIAPNLTYTPSNNVTGADSFTFKVNDGTVDSVAAAVSINIAVGPNSVPVATAQSVTTAEDTAKSLTLTGTDVDGDMLTFVIVAAPTHGTLAGTAPNLAYLPATNYNGADSFTFKANDGATNSTPAIVSITVTAVNDAPVASAQSVTTAEDTAKAITLTGSDVDGNSLTFAVVTQPTHGTLAGTAPNLTYSPATNYNGGDNFTFVANDGLADSATVTVTISVAPTVIQTSPDLPTVSVTKTVNASEPTRAGSFGLARTGNTRKTLTVRFTLDGTATPGVDFKIPGTNVTFAIGKTNATVVITPIANRLFEGNETVVLTLVETTNYFTGNPETAAITLADDDRPQITITTAAQVVALAAAGTAPTDTFALKIKGLAITNYSQILQCSTNLVNWNVVAAPPTSAATDYTEFNPTGMPQRFYRVLYVAGEITTVSIAEALTNQMVSANIVGAVNIQIQPGWNLAANPLNGYTTNGPVGVLPAKTAFQAFNSRGLNTYSGSKWSRGVPLTRSTTGGWFYNPTNEPVNITYVGTVPNPATQPSLPAGWCVRSSPVDVVVGNDKVLNYTLYTGDALYEFNPLGSTTNMWNTHIRGFTDWDTAPQLTAGQGVLIYKTTNTRPTVTVAPKDPTRVHLLTHP